MSIRSPRDATCVPPPSIDLTEESIAEIDEFLGRPWAFAEDHRYLEIYRLHYVQVYSCAAMGAAVNGEDPRDGNDYACLVDAVASVVAAMLGAAGWVVGIADSGGDAAVAVTRPAHLPPAVRFVDGAWVPFELDEE